MPPKKGSIFGAAAKAFSSTASSASSSSSSPLMSPPSELSDSVVIVSRSDLDRSNVESPQRMLSPETTSTPDLTQSQQATPRQVLSPEPSQTPVEQRNDVISPPPAYPESSIMSPVESEVAPRQEPEIVVQEAARLLQETVVASNNVISSSLDETTPTLADIVKKTDDGSVPAVAPTFETVMRQTTEEGLSQILEDKIKRLEEVEQRLQTLRKESVLTNPVTRTKIIYLLAFGQIAELDKLLTVELKQNPGIAMDSTYIETLAGFLGITNRTIERILVEMSSKSGGLNGQGSGDVTKITVLQTTLSIVEMITKLLGYGFVFGNAASELIKTHCLVAYGMNQQSGLCFIEPVVGGDAGNAILDLIIMMLQKQSPDVVDVAILKDIHKYRLPILQTLIDRGLDIRRKIDGFSVAYWAMRAATKVVYVSDPTTLNGLTTSAQDYNTTGYKTFSTLRSSKLFDWTDVQQFIGCEIKLVFEDLIKSSQFLQAMRQPVLMPAVGGNAQSARFLIDTINSSLICTLLINYGCPKSGMTAYSRELANNLAMMQSIVNMTGVQNVCDATSEMTPLATTILYGDGGDGNYEVIDWLSKRFQGQTKTLSLNGPNYKTQWTPIHFAIHKFDVQAYFEAQNESDRAAADIARAKEEAARAGHSGETIKARPLIRNDLIELGLLKHTHTRVKIVSLMYDRVEAGIDAYGRTPLMCMELKMNKDQIAANWNQIMTLYKMFGIKEIQNMRAQGFVMNYSPEDYARKILMWYKDEIEARKREGVNRSYKTDTELLKKHFDWVHK